MSNKSPLEILNSMSKEQIESLMKEEIPAEIEKEAAAEVDNQLLSDNLYNFGFLTAAEALASEEGEGDLSKVASADEIKEHNEALSSAQANIETLVEDLGIAECDDEVELAKTAQAMAGIMFKGWSDCMLKSAAARNPGMVAKHLAKLKGGLKAGLKKGKAVAGKALKAARKRPGRAAAIAGGVVGAGALGYLGKKKMQEKRASAPAGDSVDVALQAHEDMDKIASIAEGFDKLAAHAEKCADEVSKHLKGAK